MKFRWTALSQSKALAKITRIFLHDYHKEATEENIRYQHDLHISLTSYREKPTEFKSSPWDSGHEQFEELWLLVRYPDWREKKEVNMSSVSPSIHLQTTMKLKDKQREATK